MKITLLLKRFLNPNQAQSLMILTKKISSLAILVFCLAETGFAQPGTQVDLKKPQEYENRKLRSEESGEKKMGLRKRIFQNTYTHYNYFFNANNKMNEVIERAKASFKDDYTKLLPFYPYTLEGTAQQRNEIDSVIYKCTAGILLHDLRNDWIDNLYMLMGKAYMFRKDFDSATQTFQYINYAYSPKDGGYDIAIGSNSSNTNGVFTIATKETKNVLKKAVTHPPSRNESFIWQARNYVEQGELSDAAGLIEILRADPNFPKRLKTELYEVISYWFYNQNAYDSSAHYLGLALNEADTRQDKARWEYLMGQLYAMAGKNDLAVKYFDRSIKHSIDPVMEVYARLNAIRINNSGKKDSYIQDNLNDLLKMAKKDKYQNYKDIIYYTAAQVELERNNTAGAIKWLKKSVEAGSNNPSQKAESFLLLADLNYNTKGYIDASVYYDSTAVESLSDEKDKARVTDRRPALKTISGNVQKINLQDSLQRIAGMPEAERDAYIRKLVKQLRKAKGLKDEPGSSGSSSGSGSTDLFADTKADWYFSNPNLKSKGFSEFKSRWGDRPNVDNWRRQQAVNRAKVDLNVVPGNDVGDKDTAKDEEISFESILAKLPLTQQQIDASNSIIQKALFENGQVFEDKLEDYQSAIEVFEELLRRFPNTQQKEQILFNLVYMYGKVNNPAKQQAAREQLIREFPNGKLTQTIKEVSAADNAGKKVDAATKKYEQIYSLFIEGKFAEAITEKRAADAQYGNSYWTPQLLFIEAIYYIKQREDSTAINRLTALKTQFSKSPLAEKAARMIDVLSRRKQIENYLTNLDVQRKETDQVKRVDMDNQQIVTQPVVVPKDVTNKTVATDKPLTVKVDTLSKAPAIIGASAFTFNATDKHYALVILDNVDGMYVSEVKNAFNRWNAERYSAYRLSVSNQALTDKLNLVLIGPFKDAAMATDYVTKTKPQTAGSILPWLSAEKFSFLIIDNANLQLLNENKDLPAYRKLITETLPGKF